MSVTAATWLVWLGAAYLLVGVVFAIPFVLRWTGRIDPVAREGTWGFRILIFPGAVALWPMLATRLLQGITTPPEERSAHVLAARGRSK